MALRGAWHPGATRAQPASGARGTHTVFFTPPEAALRTAPDFGPVSCPRKTGRVPAHRPAPMALLALVALAAALSPVAAAVLGLAAPPSAASLLVSLLAQGPVQRHKFALLNNTYTAGFAVPWLQPLGQVTSCTAAQGEAICDGDTTCGFVVTYDKACYLLQTHATGFSYDKARAAGAGAQNRDDMYFRSSLPDPAKRATAPRSLPACGCRTL